MKVKLLCNLGTNDFPATPFKDGEVHEVTDELGNKLVGQRLAIDVTPPPEPVIIPPELEAPPAPSKFEQMRSSHKPVTAATPKAAAKDHSQP